MSNIHPNQQRAIDSYSSYNSNTFNVFTRIVTGGTNAILSNNAIDVLLDSTTPETKVVITTGICFKDDVMINLTDEFEVDFTDVSFYDSTTSFDEEGYYYVLLQYTYVKSLPAPQASILILKPSQRMSFSSEHLMLKIVEVSFNGMTFEISDLLEYDPEIPTHKRIYTSVFASLVDTLPTFDDSDKGKILYDKTNDLAYMGMLDGWRSIASFDYPCDTHLCSEGQLVYLNTSGVAQPALATDFSTFALGFVVKAGFTGLIRLNGFVSNGRIEPGVTISIGDRLFLSKTNPGTMTNVVPTSSGVYQAIGKCFNTDGTSYVVTVLCNLGNAIGTIPYHNEVLGIQGGDSSNRYHLTLSDSNHVINQDFTHNNLTIKQGGDGTNFYHVSNTTFTNIGDGQHNSLANIQGGDSTGRYHLSQMQYNNVGGCVPIGTIIAFFPGYIDGIFHSFWLGSLVGSNDAAGVNAYLASIGGNFKVCDGTAPNDPSSPIWNTPTKYLPILLDSRFLQGVYTITYGSYAYLGGSNSVSHNHTITIDGHSLTVDELPAHTHTYATPGGLGASLSAGSQVGITSGTTGSSGSNTAHNHGGSIGSTSTDNRPQYLKCFYIIRIK